MLTIIEGNVGSGKTLFLVIFAKTLLKKKIVSNFKLKMEYEQFNVSNFLLDKYDNCAIYLDEIYAYIDSRISGSEMSRNFSYKLFQGRKKGIDIFGTLQLFNTIDVRYRKMVDIYIRAFEMKNSENKTIGFEYQIFNRKTSKTVIKRISFEKAQQFFDLYDTKEVITPLSLQNYMKENELLGKERIEKIQKIANDIRNSTKNLITHGLISLFLSENKIPKFYQEEIYAYMKEYQMLKSKKKKTSKKKGK